MLKEFLRGTKSERDVFQNRDLLRARNHLSAQAKEKLGTLEKEAKKISRKLFVRRAVGVVASTALVVAAIGLTGSMLFSEQRQGVSIRVEDEAILGSDRVQQAITAAVEWDNRYHCGREITIRELKWPGKQDLGEGKISTTQEEAGAGYIELGLEGDARNITLHAMTHACKPDKPTVLAVPLPFADGVITGYHGFTLLVTLKDGSKSNFTKIEEAMAERNASVFSGYTIEDARYFAVGNLARRDFPFNKFPDIENGFRKNNVPALIRARFNLPASALPTAKQHTALMDEFQQAWDKALR